MPYHPRSRSPMQNLRVTDWSNIIRCFICLEHSQISQWSMFRVLVFPEGLDYFPMVSTKSTKIHCTYRCEHFSPESRSSKQLWFRGFCGIFDYGQGLRISDSLVTSCITASIVFIPESLPWTSILFLN